MGLDPESAAEPPQERVLTWPEGVKPGNKHTVTNVSLHPDDKTVSGVWNTNNVSAWKGDTSKMPECESCKVDAKIGSAVNEALKPTEAPVVKMDNPALAAAKHAVEDGAVDGDTVQAAAAGGSGAKLQAVTLTFELRNVNYHMLDEPATRSPAMGSFSVPDAGHFSALESDGPVDIETPILEESSHDATNGEMIQSAVKQSIE